MSTKSMIGIEGNDGKIRAVYCHWDGHRENWGFREAVERVHMVGQLDAGFKHPVYSNARTYFDTF